VVLICFVKIYGYSCLVISHGHGIPGYNLVCIIPDIVYSGKKPDTGVFNIEHFGKHRIPELVRIEKLFIVRGFITVSGICIIEIERKFLVKNGKIAGGILYRYINQLFSLRGR
jgi:hypothetical protein